MRECCYELAFGFGVVVNHCAATVRRGEGEAGAGGLVPRSGAFYGMAGRQASEERSLPPSLRATLSLVGGGERPASVCAINMVANLVARLRGWLLRFQSIS